MTTAVDLGADCIWVHRHPPTLRQSKTVEPHLLHRFEHDFYGSTLKFLINGYLRPEKNFDSLESLVAAINDDIAMSEKWLETPEAKASSLDSFFK